MSRYIYVCEDNVEGIFTGIFDAWASGAGHDSVYIQVNVAGGSYDNYELFSEYTDVVTDNDKAVRVGNAIRQKIGNRAYEMVIRASLTTEADKADAIYRFLILGFSMGRSVVNHMASAAVMRIFELNRFVANDEHFYKGFLRFEEIEGGIMLAKYEPQNNITAVLAPHFADRFPDGNFIIYDIRRKLAAVHQAGKAWVLVSLSDELIKKYSKSSDVEEEYKNLWISFFNVIGVKERKNEKLQKQMLRLHYRKNMTEFQFK